ncbi:hypothetical protein Rs2_16108 [Raphanus sativus]|nr:hypothetical protein Rs2_16108 [Raphanus sativus]
MARRRTRSAAKNTKQSLTTKQKRYPVSESDEGKNGSSRDSTAEGSSPVHVLGGEVGSSSSRFPTRPFAVNYYPTALRLNIYSKANLIGAIASCLRGTPDMDILLESQFGRLCQLPVARCHNSTKLLGCLLCRQLVTNRRFEPRFTFGTHPLRFSLDEFHAVTGFSEHSMFKILKLMKLQVLRCGTNYLIQHLVTLQWLTYLRCCAIRFWLPGNEFVCLS